MFWSGAEEMRPLNAKVIWGIGVGCSQDLGLCV